MSVSNVPQNVKNLKIPIAKNVQLYAGNVLKRAGKWPADQILRAESIWIFCTLYFKSS
ncbi:MAG TPA: hypothetical protein VK080_00510 [Lentibacillus sp.]|nr:hypothetical protein [Lentibacillus sp.]HLS07532.1 hypothetical protein [Lentibacillus sp.]